MKKWLVTCLLAIALLFVATTAMAAHIRLNGDYCEGNTFEIRKREKDYHTLYCYRCYDEFTENHWSIDTPQYKATCTKVAVCTSCLMSYGEYGPHDWGAWQSRGNNSEHIRHCQRDGCDAVDTASCSGDSSATCITLGTCSTCGGQYYSAHAFPAGQNWHSDDKNHWLSCTVCHEAKTKMGAHWFVQGAVSVCLKSAATCVAPAVYYTNCDYCYHKGTDTYVDPNNGPDPNNHDLVHHDAKAPTCTEIGWDEYDACQREGCTYTTKVEIPALKHKLVHHDAKAPTCTETGWEEYDTCSRCDYTTKVEIPALKHKLVHHDAKAPTCTETGWEEYDTCSRCDYTTKVEIPAPGHDYTEKVVKPTCGKGGYTLHTCKKCHDSYKDHQTKTLLHWYGEWTSNGDGTHSAACKREDCKRVSKTECAIVEFKQDEATRTLCPVCGNVSDGTHLALVEEVTAEGEHLPYGELVLRMGETANGNTLLSVCFEVSGKLTQPKGEVKITMPAELPNGVTLALLNADGTEIALPYIIEGENAVFTLDFTDAEIPTALIRLIPTAE
ncbi:MAG TPA: hypothetical protein OGM06_08055 [Clostridiales bacterium]|nr:hypothetical protein [Clostridiales bacterium]